MSVGNITNEGDRWKIREEGNWMEIIREDAKLCMVKMKLVIGRGKI